MVLLCSVSIYGQSPAVVSFDMHDGLPSNKVYRALQDSTGHIWFCTDKGLVKFDGYDFDSFEPKKGLPHQDIFNIHLDKDSKLWLSTYDTICYIKNDSLIGIKKPNSQIKNGLVLHRFTAKGNHFIEFRGNKTEFYIEKNDSIILFDSAEHKYILDIDSQNDFIYLAKNGKPHPAANLCKIENGVITYKTLVKLRTSHFAYGRVHIGELRYYFEKDTVYKWDGESIQRKSYMELFGKSPDIYSVKAFNDGIIVQGFEENYALNKDLEIIKDYDYLLDKNFNSLIKDKEDNLWVCSNTGILYYLSKSGSCKNYLIPNEDDKFVGINKHRNGAIFLATKRGAIYQYQKDENFTFIHQNELDNVHKIITDTIHNWIYQMDFTKNINSVPLENSNPNLSAFHHQLKNTNFSHKNIDLSANNKIAVAHSKGVSEVTPEGNNLIFNTRSYAVHYHKDALYIGTTTRIYTYLNGQIEPLHTEEGKAHITHFYTDKENQLWALPNKGGLWKIIENKIKNYPELQDLKINRIIEDDKKQLWLGTTSGLYLFNKKHNQKNSLKKIGSSYGILEDNIIDLIYDKNHIYAISDKQLHVLPSNIKNQLKHTSFGFESSFINGEKISLEGLQNLNHKDNNIRIDFKTISLSDLNDLSYEWILEPVSKDWEKTKETSLQFNSLSPGDYNLKIKTYDSNQTLINEQSELKISISKPWYESLLFYVILTVLFFTGLILYEKWRKQKEIIKLEHETEMLKNIYELRLKAVQAQMNPHFIFNALNSIQKFIYKKSPEEANQYIVKFANLMRMILESTSKNYSSLKEEIDLLNSYINLEQLRFDNKFSYHLELDENIDSNNTFLPSTILQPFVENAINHGLASKTGKGNLWIRFKKNPETLVCEIEDDGIGREKASQKKKTKHNSKALQIIKERQEILKERDNYNIDFRFIDLKNNNGKAFGTKLILEIPNDK